MSALLPKYPAACPDCPGARLGALEELVGDTKESCGFDTVRLESRAFAPASWPERYGFGMIRRGVLIRQRVDPKGRAIAIDAAGAGCVFPIDDEPAARTVSCDYAATDVVLCLCTRSAMERALDESHQVGRDLLALQRATLARVERIAQARGGASAKEKVAMLISALSDDLSPPLTRVTLPAELQQRDLAKLVGVRHETFCRVMKALERDGVLDRDDGAVRVLDRAALDAI